MGVVADVRACLVAATPRRIVDPIHNLADGTVQQIEQETRSCLDQVGRAGYIFNTGECVPRHTPAENMEAMIRTVRRTGERGA